MAVSVIGRTSGKRLQLIATVPFVFRFLRCYFYLFFYYFYLKEVYLLFLLGIADIYIPAMPKSHDIPLNYAWRITYKFRDNLIKD